LERLFTIPGAAIGAAESPAHGDQFGEGALLTIGHARTIAEAHATRQPEAGPGGLTPSPPRARRDGGGARTTRPRARSPRRRGAAPGSRSRSGPRSRDPRPARRSGWRARA